jgi:hypothetical protein
MRPLLTASMKAALLIPCICDSDEIAWPLPADELVPEDFVAPAVPALDAFDGVDAPEAGVDAAGALAGVGAPLGLTAATARWTSACTAANIGLGAAGAVDVAACCEAAGAAVVGWPLHAEVVAPFDPVVTVVVVTVVVDAALPVFSHPPARC